MIPLLVRIFEARNTVKKLKPIWEEIVSSAGHGVCLSHDANGETREIVHYTDIEPPAIVVSYITPKFMCF